MLLELKVSNFAIIDNVQLSFQDGLNILSGETGAGKSVLLKSLALLMGDKAQTEFIRSGEKTATIEGCFDLSERTDILQRLEDLDIPVEDHLLVVRRIIGTGGKSRIYINNTLSTLMNLRGLVAPLVEVAGRTTPLIEMTGQHDNRYLISKSFHIEMLDHYIGAMEQRREFRTKYQNWVDLRKKMDSLSSEAQQREQQLDFLKFQVDEIEALEVQPGDEQNIPQRVQKLKNVDRIRYFIERFSDTVYSSDHSIISQLTQLRSQCEELAKFDHQLQGGVESLVTALSSLNDVVYELRDHGESLELDSDALERETDRLSRLRKLQKKYGESAEQILAEFESMKSEIDELSNADQTLEELAIQEVELKSEVHSLAEDLHKRRLNGGTLLSESVNEELSDLNMKGVGFEVCVLKNGQLGPQGITEVEFMSRNSSKDVARPLAKVSSGGELSRILLSLKRVIGKGELPRTYLFDEVDTGVSGPTAEKVGKKLKSIARGQQVICVTHLPQVAAFGDVHFYIEKNMSSEMTVSELKKKKRVDEIARLISGEKITHTSLAHAEQLLADSR